MTRNKTIYKLAIAIVLISTAVLGTTSCKNSSSSTSNPTGTFYFHIHSNIDTNEVADTAALYMDATGRHYRLNVAQFYITGVTLHNVNGTTYTFPSACILKDLREEQFLIGTAPVGTYDYATFSVGVDAATNAIPPANQPSSSILHNPPGMWYGTGQGFIFMKVQGLADTTATQNGTNLRHFSYYIGGNSNLKTITLPVRSGALTPYILSAGSTQYIHLTCDYGKLLAGIDFKTQDSTDSYTINPALGTTLANNITDMFEYED